MLAVVVVSAGLVLLLQWCWRRGYALQHRPGGALDIGAAPFVGHWRRASMHDLLPPIVVGTLGVVVGPVVARFRRWGTVVITSSVAWVAWVLALALVDGRASITASLRSRFDHLAAVPAVGSPGRFLAHFVARIGTYPTHVRGHPPGTVLLLWALDRIGLGGSGAALAVCLLGGAAMVAGVLVATRSLAGEHWARRVAPFLALAPAAVFATNFDLLYAGLAAWAIALAALATDPGRTRGGARVAAGGSGLVLGLALLCSYGLAPMALPVAAVFVIRRRPILLAGCGSVAAAVVGAPALWGYWWLSGLAATRQQYWHGIAARRPAGYFASADVVVLAAVLGPVVVVAVAWAIAGRRVPRPLGLVSASVAAVVGLALASQLSKGEVERIWQPFLPWFVVLVPVLFAGAKRVPRTWLAVQVGTGLVLEGLLRSPW